MLFMIGQREWFEMFRDVCLFVCLFVCLHLLQQAASTWEWNRLAVPASQFRSLKTYRLTVVSTFHRSYKCSAYFFLRAGKVPPADFPQGMVCKVVVQKKDRVVTSLVVLWTYGHPWMPWPDANDAPNRVTRLPGVPRIVLLWPGFSTD